MVKSLVQGLFLGILIVFAMDRIRLNYRFRNIKTATASSKITYILASFFYIAIILISYLEYSREGLSEIVISALGILVLFFAIQLRNRSISALGPSWSFYDDPEPSSSLIINGPYKSRRHPYYFSIISELMGFALLFNSFFSIVLIFFIQIPVLVVRMAREERMCISKFGENYLSYKKRTPILG